MPLHNRFACPAVFFLVGLLQACAPADEVAPTTSELAQALAKQAEESNASYPPKLLQAGREGTEILRASGIVDSALNVGDRMPAFVLNDPFGQPVSSADLLSNGHLIVVFYRGAWCPFCNIYLHGMQKRLADFRAQGAELVAISVEPADTSQALAQKNELDYAVLSDPNLELARQFGIVYEMPKVTNDAILGVGFDIAQYNRMEKAELPLSATYIVRSNGDIAYAFLDADYKRRADPETLLAVLRKLNR